MKRLVAIGLLAIACGPSHAEDCGDATCFADEGPCFGEARTFETSLAPRHFVVGDFDSDDIVDVLAVGETPTGAVQAEVHTGNGDGTFADPEQSGATGCSVYPLGTDLDSDGSADLLYPGCQGDALVFWGAGDGIGMQPASTVVLGMLLTTADIADVDGDGNVDIVALGFDAAQAPTMTVVRGLGGRTFAPGVATALDPASVPTAVRVGDVNGDGNVDAVTWIAGVADTVAVRHGDGTGAFAVPITVAASTAAGHIAVGDLAPGGGDELVISAPSQQQIAVGTDLATDATTVAPYRPVFSTIVSFEDTDGPGALVVDGFEPEVRYYVAATSGAPEQQGSLPTPHAAQWVAAPDVDGDGAADLVVGHLARGAFSVWLSPES